MTHHFVSQLIHVVWATADQQYKIPLPVRNKLYAYLSTVIKSHEAKLYLAGGACDHVHCLISLPPQLSISLFMRIIKSHSSKWIKQQQDIDAKFAWEDGYTAFSLQHDRQDAAYKYIQGEEKRHETSPIKMSLLNCLHCKTFLIMKNTSLPILIQNCCSISFGQQRIELR